MTPRALTAVACFALCSCQRASLPGVTASQWPEADAIFRGEPKWLGSDAAYSVPLGPDRILWLFGDTFVATSAANVRSESKMVRNTVAIQTGLDPTAAAIAFAWRDGPASFFPEDGDRWLWPLHGARVGSALVLFFSHLKATPGQGLGFAGDGWRAVLIDNPDAPAAAWHLATLVPASGPVGIDVGTSVLIQGDYLVALAVAESSDHSGYLARWRTVDLAAGKLDALEWWDGRRYASGATPAKVLDNAGPECSLHFDARLKRFVHVRSEGFGQSTIVVSFADQVEGPWTAPRVAFRPPEDDRAQAFVYAAKGHPELTGAQLVVTYATNTLGDFSTLVNDPSLYYPRFVRLGFTP